MRYVFLLFLFFIASPCLRAQLTISGTVYDNSKINYVEEVRVVSTGGMFSVTDSMGRYSIIVNDIDSIYFYYKNKPTQKFSVHAIADPSNFNIALKVAVKNKYSVLKEVLVYSKTYKQDSLENRQTYADVYDYKKPGIKTSLSPGGVAGADLDELINIFRFRRNRNLKAFQHRLETQEQDKYVAYRFSKASVRRITGLQGDQLDSFMVWYRPSYEFTQSSDELVFTQYILNAFYQFKKLIPASPAKKDAE